MTFEGIYPNDDEQVRQSAAHQYRDFPVPA